MAGLSYSELPIRSLASGNHLSIPIYQFKGEGDKKVYIQANIHGPEVAGIAALYRLVKILQDQQTIHGTITIVPSINPVGLDLKTNGLQTGYADPNEYTVGNFNRIYQMLVKNKSAAEETPDPDTPHKVILEDFVAAHKDSDITTILVDFKAALLAALADLKAKKSRTVLRFGHHLAIAIQELAQDADYVIDLHTDARAIYYGYSFEQNVDSFGYFDIPYMIEIDADDFDGVLDEAFLIPWVKLQRAFKKAGRDIAWQDIDKEVITPELGNADEVSSQAADEDAGRIINYLRHKGILEGNPIPPTRPLYRCLFKHRDNYFAPVGGLVFWHKTPGDMLQKGDLVATILTPGGKGHKHLPVETPVKATRAGVLITVARSQVAHQGISLFSILTNLKKVEK